MGDALSCGFRQSSEQVPLQYLALLLRLLPPGSVLSHSGDTSRRSTVTTQPRNGSRSQHPESPDSPGRFTDEETRPRASPSLATRRRRPI
jgi:hypothetical protein